MCGKRMPSQNSDVYILYHHFRNRHSREERLLSAGMLEFCQAIAADREWARWHSIFELIIQEQEEAACKGPGILAAE